jgi:RimJ/RimL family protein N-acetyltransferase
LTGGSLLRRDGVARDGRRWLIRPAVDADADALVRLRDAVAAEGGLVAAVPGERTPLQEQIGLAGIVSRGGLAVVCEVDGDIVGQLQVVRRVGSYDGHVGDLSVTVASGQRGVGLGSAMLATAVEWARAVRIRKLTLSVFPDNARAIAAYERAGFVEEGRQRAQVHVAGEDLDVVLMGLVLQ